MEANEEKNKISDATKELEDKLTKTEKDREEYLNGWKRAKADLINYQKDEMKRLAEAIKFGNEELIEELLTVLDSFDLSLASMKAPTPDGGRDPDQNIGNKKGMEIIQSQLENILHKYGLEPIKSIGEKFDPSIHETIEEVKSERESGTVVEELIKGWKLHGKTIRPAKVKVAK